MKKDSCTARTAWALIYAFAVLAALWGGLLIANCGLQPTELCPLLLGH